MFYETDLADFLMDFGESAIINSGTEITVIYDNEYASAAPMGADIESSKPTAIAKTTDVEELSHGATVEIRGIIYKVVGIQPDGTGFTTLILSE